MFSRRLSGKVANDCLREQKGYLFSVNERLEIRDDQF